MFNVEYEKIEFKPKWDRLFSDRIGDLKGNTCRIVYLYETPDTSTFRYRVFNVVNVINEYINEFSACYVFESELVDKEIILSKCDLLVICRVNYSHNVATFIELAKVKNIKVIYDIDDLIFDSSYANLILDSLDKNLYDEETWNYWYAYIARKGDLLKQCDGAITTNDYLAEKVSSFAGIPCHVIQNFFNREQLLASDHVFEQKLKNKFSKSESLSLGYFSGSSTHNKDFNVLSSALVRLFNNFPDIKLHIVGFIDLKGDINNYRDRIIFHPYQDYVNLQYLIGSVNINLIPLNNNTFTNGKSELKYFESAIGGTVSIASPTYIYKQVIQNGVNGYLSDEYSWTSNISNIIENFKDYPNLALEARGYAINKYAWYEQAGSIRSQFKKILS